MTKDRTMDNLAALRLPVLVLGFGAWTVWRAVKNLANLRLWKELIESNLTVQVSEAIYALEYGYSEADVRDKVVPVNKKNSAAGYRCAITGSLYYDPTDKTFALADFTRLDVLQIVGSSRKDFTEYYQPTKKITTRKVMKGGIETSHTETFRHIGKYAPIVMLGTLFMDAHGGRSLKIKDLYLSAPNLRELQIKIESEEFFHYVTGIFGAFLILGSLSISRKTIVRAISALRLRLKRWFLSNDDIAGFDDDQMCIVCYAVPRAILVQPCKHFAYCVECYAEMNRAQCLVCRNQVTHNEIGRAHV